MFNRYFNWHYTYYTYRYPQRIVIVPILHVMIIVYDKFYNYFLNVLDILPVPQCYFKRLDLV